MNDWRMPDLCLCLSVKLLLLVGLVSQANEFCVASQCHDLVTNQDLNSGVRQGATDSVTPRVLGFKNKQMS